MLGLHHVLALLHNDWQLVLV